MSRITIDDVRARLEPERTPEPPAELRARICEEIPDTFEVAGAPRRRWVLPLWLGSVAAAAMVMLFVGSYRKMDSAPRLASRGPLPTAMPVPTATPSVAAETRERLKGLGYSVAGKTGQAQGGQSSDSDRIYSDGQFLQSPDQRAARPPVEPGWVSKPQAAHAAPAKPGYAAAYHLGDESEKPRVSADRAPTSADVELLTKLGYIDATSTVPPPSAPAPDMTFRDHGVNRATDTTADNLSTFALDVDTGSYTLVRRYLHDGHLPPPAAVRVEEFVNSFDYGDAPPEGQDFAIRTEGAPTPFVPGMRYRLVRIGIKARAVERAERKPAVLTFVIDTSGSMDMENRLGLVKRALGLLLEELRPDDQLALVTFSDRGHILLEHTHDHASIARAIASLRAGGSTNVEEGLSLAYQIATARYERGAINRVILLSDGVANVGLTTPEEILGRIGEAAAKGIELTTVGVGMGNYNDALMEQLADKGDGRYAYVDSLDEAHKLFSEQISSTLETIAADARAQVAWNPRVVERYRLLGYENRALPDARFRDDRVDAGEIGAGHAVSALYEIKLASEPAPNEPLGTVHVRYRRKSGGQVVEMASAIAPAAMAASWEDAPRSLRLAAVVGELAETMEQAPPGREHDAAELVSSAHRVELEWRESNAVRELISLVDRASVLGR